MLLVVRGRSSEALRPKVLLGSYSAVAPLSPLRRSVLNRLERGALPTAAAAAAAGEEGNAPLWPTALWARRAAGSAVGCSNASARGPALGRIYRGKGKDAGRGRWDAGPRA